MRRLALVTLLAFAAVACADADCDATSALPVVSVDLAGLEPAQRLDRIEVCVDGECTSPGESDEPLLLGEETQARFLVPDIVDDTPTVTILVRTDAGEPIVAPTPVALTRFYPNGEQCDGDAWQGWFEVTPEGGLVEVPRT